MIKMVEDKVEIDQLHELKSLKSDVDNLYDKYLDHEDKFGSDDKIAKLFSKLRSGISLKIDKLSDTVARHGAGNNY